MLKFLDVSNYNTINDYEKLATSGLSGIIVKASEGTTFTDGTLDEKYLNLKGKTNIVFYHFLTSTSEPETQAQHFYNLIKDKQFQITPILDVEQASLNYLAENFSNRFMVEFKKLSGLDMLIYSNASFIQTEFSNKFCNNNIFWVASFGVIACPALPECKQIVAWQYTDKCLDYSFINGGVDCSYLYDERAFFKNVPRVNYIVNYNAVLQQEINTQGFRDRYGHALIVDGIFGVLTLSACPMLHQYGQGKITMWVQHNLGVSETAIFDLNTVRAVKLFQKINGLIQDGIVGQLTWKKLLGI